MRKGKAMKKKCIIMLSLMVLLFGSINSHAQVFIMEDDEFNIRINDGHAEFPFPGMDPAHDTTWDYTPIGNGIWLLGGLAGAYLLGKRKRKDDE